MLTIHEKDIQSRGSTLDIPATNRAYNRIGCKPDDWIYNGTLPMVVGPLCDDLHQHLRSEPAEEGALKEDTDKNEQWKYGKSPINDIYIREMIASTVLAVLPFAHEQTTIVVDDKSGRIPGRTTHETINLIRAQQGLDPARIAFVSGKIGDDRIPDFEANGPDDTALIVTEHIRTGIATDNIHRALGRVGFETINIATVDRDPLESKSSIRPNRVFIGNTASYIGRADGYYNLPDLKAGNPGKGLYHIRPEFTGVTDNPDTHAPHTIQAELGVEGRRAFNKTIRDIGHFARIIAEIYTDQNLPTNNSEQLLYRKG